MRIRSAKFKDLSRILEIYNQGIEDRMSTFEPESKDLDYIQSWFVERKGKYIVIVAINEGKVIGWASISQYNPSYIYSRVGDLSVYIDRQYRNQGIGQKLLRKLEKIGKAAGFHKFILFTFAYNTSAKSLFLKNGYQGAGIYRDHAFLRGEYIDVEVMEKIFGP